LENGGVKFGKFALFKFKYILKFLHFRRLILIACERSDTLHYFPWC